MISSCGDASAAMKAIGGKKAINCYVKESFPYLLVADDHFFVAAYLTAKAVSDFKGKNSSVNITDLKGSVIAITDWSVEMCKSSSFTSYGGMEIKLVVKGFSLSGKKGSNTSAANARNLWRDDEIKTCCNRHAHSCNMKR